MTNYQRDPYYSPPGYALPFPPPSYASAPPPPPPAGYEPFAPPPPQYQGYQSYLNQQYPPPPPSHYHCHHVQYHDDDTPGFTSFLEGWYNSLSFSRILILFSLLFVGFLFFSKKKNVKLRGVAF
ncbi:hypothetical protein V8G54_020477 [Vigna mungo]|uniref:Uncharacterized protein n=1 Tax=Vigna mungo TaxID=3915 RepID=A0AAQ3NDQ5_VIGMU